MAPQDFFSPLGWPAYVTAECPNRPLQQPTLNPTLVPCPEDQADTLRTVIILKLVITEGRKLPSVEKTLMLDNHSSLAPALLPATPCALCIAVDGIGASPATTEFIG